MLRIENTGTVNWKNKNGKHRLIPNPFYVSPTIASGLFFVDKPILVPSITENSGSVVLETMNGKHRLIPNVFYISPIRTFNKKYEHVSSDTERVSFL